MPSSPTRRWPAVRAAASRRCRASVSRSCSALGADLDPVPVLIRPDLAFTRPQLAWPAPEADPELPSEPALACARRGVRRSRPAGGWGSLPAPPEAGQVRSPYVPAGGLRMIPGATWGPIPGPDVPQAPADLGADPRPPVGAGAGHLAAGQRLRDAVRARVG